MHTLSYLDTNPDQAVAIYLKNLMPKLLAAVARPNAGERTPLDLEMDAELAALAVRNATTGLVYAQH